jgi:Rha family phage regulatory protein
MPTDKRSGLPALCAELKLRADDGVALVNSRDVAAHFGKRHADVLRDIEALSLNADLRSVWFRSSTYVDTTGRTLPSFDLTRQGFSVV